MTADVPREEVLIPPQKITFVTFHPNWETAEKNFWVKRFFLIVFAVIFLIAFISIGYSVPGSVMPATFQDPLRIVEFSMWYFSTWFLIEMWFIALHKTHTTQIKYAMSKNEEMRISIQFNRSFGLLFLLIFVYYILKMIFRFIYDFALPNSNIFYYLEGKSTLFETAFMAFLVILGFGSYSQFIFTFERTVQGRKVPLFWIIPIVGICLMLFLPYNQIVFAIQFTTFWTLDATMYYFGIFFSLMGGIVVPILYFIMASRFSYRLPQTSKDCKRKGWGFALMAIAAIFNLNYPLQTAALGGIVYAGEILIYVLLAPIFNLVGVLMVRTAYRPTT